jgi:phosphoserine phosphatase RsbU/P
VPERLRAIGAFCGRTGFALLLFLAAVAILHVLAPNSSVEMLARSGAIVAGLVLFIRVVRVMLRKLVWRLRNRLLVTYLFIAVVPIVLVVALVAVGVMSLFIQFAVFLVTSELDRRVDVLKVIAENIADSPGDIDQRGVERPIDFLRSRMPGAMVVVREGDRKLRFSQSELAAPTGDPPAISGILSTARREYFMSGYAAAKGRAVTVVAPLTQELLATLVSDLGVVDSGTFPATAGPPLTGVSAGKVPPSRFPRLVQFLDPELQWFATLPAEPWGSDGATQGRFFLGVRSRPSALLAAIFTRRADVAQGVLLAGLFVLAGLFIMAELVSLLIGIRLTRTVTGAVHLLYEGTKRVREGEFSHRINVRGDDQLADLSRSFNRMTENVEHLLAVAKEKERLQSELEIGREVQARLYPTKVPETPGLRLEGVCHPARVVSGDYFDYESLDGTKVMVAIGDVAGKGISAALLMASLQSSLRAQLAGTLDGLSPSEVVSRINRQLHSNTGPEKYATFCLGVIDESTGLFTYTNAGHLPPMLIRDGSVQKLDVNGTVVGLFPQIPYSESALNLRSGDLLVFYTDGVTEPENAYGEMYGEERLEEVLLRNADRSESGIIGAVSDAIRVWTGADELQDDLTLLLVRKL